MNLNDVIKELKKGNNLEKNLPVYGKALAFSYHRMAAYHLAMDLTEYYDVINESTDEASSACRELLKETAAMIKSCAVPGEYKVSEENISKIDNIRNSVLKQIDDIGDYTFFLQLYEHLLNRAEYRSSGKIFDFDEESFAEDVCAFVDTKEAISTNERIQAVMGELPVRMTFSKFMDIIGKGCRYYIGARSDMAEAFFESMHDCVRPVTLDGLNKEYEKLYEICEKLIKTDCNAIGADECREAASMVETAAVEISETLKLYLCLADIVNHFYIYLLTKPYVFEESSDIKKSEAVIGEFFRAVDKGSFLTPDEDIVGLLRELTKKQEKLLGEHMMLEDVFYEMITLYARQIDELALNGLYDSLYDSSRMFNESALSPLGQRKTYFAVDSAWIDAKLSQLLAHYKNCFASMERSVKRAQMAFTIGALPVVFDNLSDFKAYVRDSLLSCSDKAAKTASEELISQIMASDF